MDSDVALRTLALLREFEWGGFLLECPTCSADPDDGHELNCNLAQMIAELEAVEGTAAKVQRKENEHL